ncbi:MAG: phosphatase [Anaerolineaceae bacterium]|nr:phosphatase [Anaerolineaceae bacterium]|tara:strand:- start:90347 stop:91075 length:729 start_codon:yes stop_codon:yes gene_type:complete
MRILVIADIHANLHALEAVLKDAKNTYDVVWCLGDLVGYGPYPNKCLQIVGSLPEYICISGNHDYAAVAKMDLSTFNPIAYQALHWTQNTLTTESYDFLEKIESTVYTNSVTLTHGSPNNPLWEYITDTDIANQNFPNIRGKLCLVGHTHIPSVFSHDGIQCNEIRISNTQPINLLERQYILNPGSVGQPRDQNPLAAYGILDLAELTWQQRRVSYDIRATQDQMTIKQLPEELIIRLSFGI